MKTLGVIPARWGATRFPGKALALIHGKPMIHWVIEGARTSRELDEVLVATDDDRIAKKVQELGCRVVMTSSDIPSGTDRIFRAIQGCGADVVLNIQGDEPLINSTWIDPLAQALKKDHQLEMATLAHPLSMADLKNPNSVKVLVNRNSEAIYFSRLPIPYSRRNAEEMNLAAPCYKHIGMYGFRVDFLSRFCQTPPSLIEKAEELEQLRALDMGASIKVIFVEKPTLGVDTPEDLVKVEQWLEGQK